MEKLRGRRLPASLRTRNDIPTHYLVSQRDRRPFHDLIKCILEDRSCVQYRPKSRELLRDYRLPLPEFSAGSFNAFNQLMRALRNRTKLVSHENS